MDLPTVWFVLVALLLAAYVVLDGFDLGAGLVHFAVARDDRERRQVLRSIGPVWDGNEVFLLAAGGAIFCAFPALYARAFSGFYLPLMLVLWLLALRGLSIELRGKIENAVWRPFWDAVFSGSSGLLALVFGVALGNVLRGVPADEEGRFFLPLWGDLFLGPEPGAIDAYTLLVGILCAATLAWHGASWLSLKTDGPVSERARRLARRLVGVVAVLAAGTIAATVGIRPWLWTSFLAFPPGALFPLSAVLGIVLALLSVRGGRDGRAFLGSTLFVAGMLGCAAFDVFPYVLPSRPYPERSLSAAAAAASEHGLAVALAWFLPGMVLAAGYTVFVYRRFKGRVPLSEDDGGY